MWFTRKGGGADKFGSCLRVDYLATHCHLCLHHVGSMLTNLLFPNPAPQIPYLRLDISNPLCSELYTRLPLTWGNFAQSDEQDEYVTNSSHQPDAATAQAGPRPLLNKQLADI